MAPRAFASQRVSPQHFSVVERDKPLFSFPSGVSIKLELDVTLNDTEGSRLQLLSRPASPRGYV